MKKILLSIMLVMSLVLLVGFTSATAVYESTIVGGTIYQDVVTNGVVGASVTVVCHHGSLDYTKDVVSGVDGSYSAEFPYDQCDYTNQVSVSAAKDSLTGANQGSVSMTYGLPGVTLNVGIVNVPMVPEFGLIAGLTTVLGALGVFFFVRKK
jgi:hypothetical protein